MQKIKTNGEAVAEIYRNAQLALSSIEDILPSVEDGDIRREIRYTNARIRAKLNSYVSGANSKYLQDNVITVRAGRFVLPVKSEYRVQVPGLIHDR